MRLGRFASFSICLFALPMAALAQTAPSTVEAGFQDGFFVQTPNGDYRLVFGLVTQADGRFVLDDPPPIIDTFTLRKIRPTLTGRIARYFDFKMMPDFGGGTIVMQDAWVDVRFSPALRLRSGKDKTPVGYELLQGDAYVLFPERSLASSLVPNRDIGVQAQGDLAGSRIAYSAGVFNGIPDGTSSSTELDANSGKDLAARVVVQPFRGATGPLSGLGVHVGGTTGKESGPLPSFKTSVQQTYFSYAADAVASGRRNRLSPALFYYSKSFGGFAEYVRSTQRVSRGAAAGDVANRAWDVTGSYLLTGEQAAYGITRPKANFDPAAGHWGALQLLARYSALMVDEDAFALGFAASTASREARQVSVGANWYPSAYIKYYATFERTAFEGGAARRTEHALVFRAQVGF
jgi:phosphate-selective porin OprO/OprP